MCVEVSMSTMGLLPRSAHSMGHRPPLDLCRCWSSSLNVLSIRLVPSFAVNLQVASECVRVCEWGLTFGAYERWTVFSFTSVDVYSPSHL